MASSRADVGAREALGAVRALAELALGRRDWSIIETLLSTIDDAMLPVKKKTVEAPEVVGYGECQGVWCRERANYLPRGTIEKRRLYEVDGRQLCVGCRKRLNEAQKDVKPK